MCVRRMLEREMRAIKSLQNVTALYSVVRCGQDCRLQVECSGVCSKHVPRRQNIVTPQVTEKKGSRVYRVLCAGSVTHV